jgi:hypothetical protein
VDKAEALAILRGALDQMRQRSYAELTAFVDNPEHREVSGASGATYQVEIDALWDSGTTGGDLRVIGAIDDGGWRAFSPLTDSFIVRPDGSFVGE